MCKLEENQEAGIASGENMNLDQGQAIHKSVQSLRLVCYTLGK